MALSNKAQYLEEYNIIIKFNSTVKHHDSIVGPGSIHYYWNSKDHYDETFSLPSLTNFKSSDCI